MRNGKWNRQTAEGGQLKLPAYIRVIADPYDPA